MLQIRQWYLYCIGNEARNILVHVSTEHVLQATCIRALEGYRRVWFAALGDTNNSHFKVV